MQLGSEGRAECAVRQEGRRVEDGGAEALGGREERGEKRSTVRREVAGGLTERIVSLDALGAPWIPPPCPRPSPSPRIELEGGEGGEGWRGCRGRTKLAAISSRFRARSRTTVAPQHLVVGYTSASAPGGNFHTTMGAEGRAGKGAAFFFYAA